MSDSIPLPPEHFNPDEALIYIAQQCKAHGRPDITARIMQLQLKARTGEKGKRKRKQVLYTPRGEKIELYKEKVEELEQ